MFTHSFGYDEEVPGGFQDADLEMRELEEKSEHERDLEHESRETEEREESGYWDNCPQ